MPEGKVLDGEIGLKEKRRDQGGGACEHVNDECKVDHAGIMNTERRSVKPRVTGKNGTIEVQSNRLALVTC